MLQIELGLSADLHYEPGPEVLGLDPEMFSDLQVDVHVVPAGGHTEVNVETFGIAQLVCDRTLKKFSQKVAGTCLVVYASSVEVLRPKLRDHCDEWYVSEGLENAVDLAPVIRDSLLLALPLRAVSPEGADAEMQTSFGDSSTGVDERWSALRELKSSY